MLLDSGDNCCGFFTDALVPPAAAAAATPDADADGDVVNVDSGVVGSVALLAAFALLPFDWLSNARIENRPGSCLIFVGVNSVNVGGTVDDDASVAAVVPPLEANIVPRPIPPAIVLPPPVGDVFRCCW